MGDLTVSNKSAGTLQMFDDVLVSLFHMLAGKVGHFCCEPACFINRVWREVVVADDSILHSDSEIFFTKSRSLVNDTSTVLSRDIRSVHDSESTVLVLLVEVVEWWQILLALEVGTFQLLHDFELGFLGVLVECPQQGLEHNKLATGFLVDEFNVFKVRIDGQTN